MIIKSFFNSQSLPLLNSRHEPRLPACGKCGLSKQCHSPVMPVDGKGNRKILLIGEASGAEEDAQNKPFIGRAGKRLMSMLHEVGIDRNDCWITNSIRCRPENNRKPTPKEIIYCHPLLTKALTELQPEIIIPLGDTAVKSLLSNLWTEDIQSIGRWVGWTIPCQKLNSWICPNWHPSYLERQQEPLLDLLFLKYLKRAVKKKGRPWEKVPDYKLQIRDIKSPSEASDEIRAMTALDKPLAFDFETDRLKPDHEQSEIICCSLSDGETSIAFPWHGKAIEAMKYFLISDVPKLGWNLKFENRWIKRKLGLKVKNWLFDGMLGSHTLDSRSKITSLHFQAFVNLGVANWDLAVRPYMKSKGGGNSQNRIREADLNDLLDYCARDSLHEAQVDLLLMRKLGITHEQ